VTRKPPPQSTAAEVRAELARQCKSQAEAAELLGVQRQNMWLRLHGRRHFTNQELVTLAAWLGVPVTQFLPEPAEVAS